MNKPSDKKNSKPEYASVLAKGQERHSKSTVDKKSKRKISVESSDDTDSIGPKNKGNLKRPKESLSPPKAAALKDSRDKKADDKKSKSTQKQVYSLSASKGKLFRPSTNHKSEKGKGENVQRKPDLGKRSSASISQDNDEAYYNFGNKQQATTTKPIIKIGDHKNLGSKSQTKSEYKKVTLKHKDQPKSQTSALKQNLIEKQNKLYGLQDDKNLEGIKCSACHSSVIAPYKSEDVINEKIKTMYDFIGCKICLGVAHRGCLDEKELASLQITETLHFTKSDGEPENAGYEKDVKVFLQEQCNQCSLSEEIKCIACYQQMKGFMFSEVRNIGTQVEQKAFVHRFCALSLPEVFQLQKYSTEPKFTLDVNQFSSSDKKSLLIPKNLQRLDKDFQQVVYDKNCSVCNQECGFMVPCAQNFQRTNYQVEDQKGEKQQKKGHDRCTEVGHPFCLAQTIEWKKYLMQEVYEEASSGFEGKVTPKKKDTKILESIETTITAFRFYCQNHPLDSNIKGTVLTCYCCRGDPPMDSEEKDKVEWIACNGCQIWFHTTCAKYNQVHSRYDPYDKRQVRETDILNIIKRENPIDKNTDFWCELCVDTKNMVLGEGGKLLEKYYDEKLTQVDFNDFLSIDKRIFNKPVAREPMLGQPSHLQIKLQSDMWFAVTIILEKQITTQTLVNSHMKELELLRGNMMTTVTYFTDLKTIQADESMQLFNAMLPNYALVNKVYDIMITEDVKSVNDKSVDQLIAQQEKVKPFIDQLESKNTGGHLKGITETVYVDYKRREVLIKAAKLLKADFIESFEVYEMLDHLRRLDCHRTHTFARFKEIKVLYEKIQQKLPTVQQNINDVHLLEKPMKNIHKMNEKPWDSYFKNLDHRNSEESRIQIIKEIQARLDTLQSYGQVKKQINNYNENNVGPVVNFKPYLLEVEACEQYLKGLVDKPVVDTDKPKPVDQLLRNICYLALQPIKVDIETLVTKYLDSAAWEQKIRKYIGDNKDYWLKLDLNKASQRSLPTELGERPQGVIFDKNLDVLAKRKALFIAERKKISGKLLADDGASGDQLDEYILEAKKAFKQLQDEINLVQCKLDLLNRVLSIVGGDPNFEEQLPEVIHRVRDAKGAGINLPEDLMMLLEAKMAIIEELRCEFNAALIRCADSFIKESVSEMRKILQKATKEHQLQMEKEKKIVDSLSKSEEWFVGTFAKLKQMCGPQLHNIDFKDYAQLYSVIKTIQDCEMLLKLPPNVKADNLVAAARNLFSSLQGAKWLFEVNALMQGGQQGHQGKELSYLLKLYRNAQELQINFSQIPLPDGYIQSLDEISIQQDIRNQIGVSILTDEEPHPNTVIGDFEQIALNAVEFDSLFGTHQKIIQTLERFESLGQISQLVETVDRISTKLLQISQSNKCLISPSQELIILDKVRNYINLNQEYLGQIKQQEEFSEVIQKPDSEGMEIDHESVQQQQQMQQVGQINQKKISYQKALKLQRQAKESQIPDDVPVLKRLNQSIQTYERLKKQCLEYFKFREKLKSKGQNYLAGLGSNIPAEKLENQNDSKFTQLFVLKLIREKESQEIESSSDIFDSIKIQSDLQRYERWKTYAEAILKRLEKDFSNNGEMQLDSDITTQFLTIKDQVCESPVFNHELFTKLQAFDWIYSVNKLLSKAIIKSETQIHNLSFWKQMYDQHTHFLQELPVLKEHTILQRILWEIELAKGVIEFVQSNKNTQRSLAAKFVLSQKQESTDATSNYLTFKSKQQRDKFHRMIETSQRLKVDLTSEINDLRNWLTQHDSYTEMSSTGMLWKQGYDKLKMMQRNIFNSPIDNSVVYADIEERLKIADEIRGDLKAVMEQAVQQNRRIKYSRVEFDLSHFSENCQISFIPEVEIIQKQIKQSQDILESCEQMIENESESLDTIRETYLTQIPIDLELDEMPLKKEIFEKTVLQLQDLPYSQFKLLEKDYLKLKHQLSKMDFDFSNATFDSLRVKVNDSLQKIKSGIFSEIFIPEVDFIQVIAEKKARLYQLKIKKSGPIGSMTQLADDQVMKGSDEDASMESDSSDDESSSSSSSQSNSQDETSDIDASEQADGDTDMAEGGEDEMQEGVLGDQEKTEKEGEDGKLEESGSSSSDDSSDDESGDEEEEEDVGVALGRERRNIKPNMMDDHIYFVKKSSKREDAQYFVKKTRQQEQHLPQLSKSQLLAKKQAKTAAKQFERQKQKTSKEVNKPTTSLDFTTLQPSEDAEIMENINQMRLKIRNQFQAKITICLEDHTCFGEKGSQQFTQLIKAITLELEDLVATKYNLVDNQYRSKIGDVCRNIDTLKACAEIAELYLSKRVYSIKKLMQMNFQFKEQFERAVQIRNERKRQSQRPVAVKRLPQGEGGLQQSQQQQQIGYNPMATGPIVFGQRPGFLMPQIKTIQVEDYANMRRNSVDSIESLEQNPARFSDDEQPNLTKGGYDPMASSQLGNRLNQPNFALPPPGVPLVQFNYDPTMYLQTQLSQKNQNREILYDPIAHGNQPFVPQKQRLTVARQGSLLKVYEGALDLGGGQKDGQIAVQLCSFQDVKNFQKLPMPAKVLNPKGKITIKQAIDHFMKVKSDPSAGMLLKGYVQRQSYLNGDGSDKYQRFFDNMEQTQSVTVYNLLEGVSVYLIPLSKLTREFITQMGILTDSSHLDTVSTTKNTIDFELETHMFAWISQIRQQLPVRSSNIWNPTVLKNLLAPVEKQAASDPQRNHVKYSSPITSEEASHESQQILQTKKRVEINLIQPAQPVYSNPGSTVIKAEQSADPEDMDEQKIDELIARLRNHGETVEFAQAKKILEPIILKYSSMGRRNEKIEAFLRELIAKKEMIDKVKQEPGHPQPSMSNIPKPQGYYQQQPPSHTNPEQFQQYQQHQLQQQMYQQPPPNPYFRPQMQPQMSPMQHHQEIQGPPQQQQHMQQFYQPRPQFIQPQQQQQLQQQQFPVNQMRQPGYPGIRAPPPQLPQMYQPQQQQQINMVPPGGQMNPQQMGYPGQQQQMFTPPPFPPPHFYPGPPPMGQQNVPRPLPPNNNR